MPAFLALNGAAVLAAFALGRALGLGARPSAGLLATLAGYLVVVHSTVLATGLAGHLTVGALLGVLGALAAVALWAPRRSGPGEAAERRAADRFSAAALVAPTAAVTSAVVWVWPHLFGATRLWVWDDYTYHMVYPALWLRDHVVAAATPEGAFTMQAWFPLSGSVVAAWFMAPFAGSRADALAWVSLTGILYAGLVAAAAAELLARLGCRRGAWAVPVLLFATSQRIDVMASSFSDADLALAATLFGAFAFALPRGGGEVRYNILVDAVYAGLLSGIALGVKISAAPAALIVVGILAWRAGTLAAGGRVAAIVAAGWLVTGGYWYARNVVHTGNPVYPAAFLGWPGVTFPETTLVEYARRWGLPRTIADTLAVYLNWPRPHAVLAVAAVVGLGWWLARRWRSTTPARRSFACATLGIVGTTLALLPAAPFSAGNAMTFRSGFVHWDSMRYVGLLPIVSWTALGFLIDAGAGAAGWRTLAAIAVVVVGIAASTAGPWLASLVALAVVAVWLGRRRMAVGQRPWRGRAAALAAIALVVLIVSTHRAKAGATGAAILGDPLFGAAAAVLDRQPPGTRVAVFGDQWVYPTLGGRDQLRPVRLDRDGRVASAPIGDEMTPAAPTVDPATFRANVRAAGVAIVVVVHQPHPGRTTEWPGQHAALEGARDAELLHRDRATAIWRLR